MEFRTKYDRKRVFTEPGNEWHDTFTLRYDDNGVEYLETTGRINVQEQIQSYGESTDIHKILERYGNGDLAALNRKTPIYGDFSEMPKTLAGYLNLFRDAENAFAQLPSSVRSEFNNSPTEFIAAIGTDRFNKSLGLSNDGDIKEKEVFSTDEPKSE